MAGRVLDAVNVPGKESLAAWFALKGLRTQWRYAVGLLFPSPEFMRLHYGLSNRWQLVCWYVKRPAQLCLNTLRGLVQLLTGSLRRRSS